MNFISKMLAGALELFIPRSCAGCNAPNEALCAECRAASYSKWFGCVLCGARNLTGYLCQSPCRRKAPYALKKVIWAGTYDNELKEAVWQLKYGRRKELARPLASLVAQKLSSTRDPISVSSQRSDLWKSFTIIPVPLHPLKEYERGFNQAQLIAEALGKEMGVAVISNILERTRNTEPQARALSKEARIENMKNAFAINHKALNEFSQKTQAIILVDDVATTGATLFDAARALEEAGFQNIIGALVAHG